MWSISCLIFCEILKFLLLCYVESDHFLLIEGVLVLSRKLENCTAILGILRGVPFLIWAFSEIASLCLLFLFDKSLGAAQ